MRAGDDAGGDGVEVVQKNGKCMLSPETSKLTVFKYLSILKTVFLKFLSGNSVIYVISKSVSVDEFLSGYRPNWLASYDWMMDVLIICC